MSCLDGNFNVINTILRQQKLFMKEFNKSFHLGLILVQFGQGFVPRMSATETRNVADESARIAAPFDDC